MSKLKLICIFLVICLLPMASFAKDHGKLVKLVSPTGSEMKKSAMLFLKKNSSINGNGRKLFLKKKMKEDEGKGYFRYLFLKEKQKPKRYGNDKWIWASKHRKSLDGKKWFRGVHTKGVKELYVGDSKKGIKSFPHTHFWKKPKNPTIYYQEKIGEGKHTLKRNTPHPNQKEIRPYFHKMMKDGFNDYRSHRK